MIVNKLVFSKWSASGLRRHGFVNAPSGTVVLSHRVQTHWYNLISHIVTGLSETQLLVDLEVVCGIVAKTICWHLEILFKIVSMCMCACLLICMCVTCVQGPAEASRRHQIPWNSRYTLLGATPCGCMESNPEPW